MEANEGIYNDSPILILRESEDEQYPLSFGLRRAKLLLESKDRIVDFVKKYGG